MLIPMGYDFFSEKSRKYCFVLPFSLPAVAQVGVVADDRHQPALVIFDTHVVNLFGVLAVSLPRSTPGFHCQV